MTQLRDLLTPVKTKVHVDDPENAKLVSVKLHGKGAVRRALGEGKAPKPFVGTRASQGQFIFSRIWARRGAMAIIPQELDGVVVTNEFPVFDIDAEKLDARYFHWLVQSSRFLEQLQALSAGASGQNRVKESSFLSLDVALPSLTEQRRIASILDRADELRNRCNIIASDYAKLQSALVENVSSAATANTRLGDLAEVSSGITKGRKTAEATRELPYLAVSNVQAGYLDMTLVKTIAATKKEIERYALRAGDVLMTEGGDPDKLGRGTVWRDELPLCLHQNHVFKVRVNDTNVLHPEFLGAYLGSRAAKDYFLRSAKQTTGIATINMTQLKNLPVPNLSNSDQLQFISQLDAIREQQKHNRIFAARLDSLFMALQSNAFSGRL